jgi:hypothetical protein
MTVFRTLRDHIAAIGTAAVSRLAGMSSPFGGIRDRRRVTYE